MQHVDTATYRIGALWTKQKARHAHYPTGPIIPAHIRAAQSAPLRLVETQSYFVTQPRVAVEPITPIAPIFILSPLPRSGTNYLFELLCSHPACVPGRLPEDMMLRSADLLEQYAQKLHGYMLKGWKVDGNPIDSSQVDEIMAMLGSGLLRYLSRNTLTQPKQRLITKTPWTQNLQLFRRIFPEAFALLLVRDGRSTIASIQRASPHLAFDAVVESWAKAGAMVFEFLRDKPSDRRSRLVRYEDVLRDVCHEMEELLGFLELSPTPYDWQRALNLPVFGSSFSEHARGNPLPAGENLNIVRQTKLSPNFNYVVEKRSENFNPIERWHDWTPEQHRIYADVAGETHRALGYTL